METEGLFTEVWGPYFWHSLHSISFNYPYNPTDQDKVKYLKYFMSVGDVLPCCVCRKHYKEHITSKENSTIKLTVDVLKNRETLTRWLYNLHQKVTETLGYKYDVDYETMYNKYNSYVTNCEMTSEKRKNAFINFYDVPAPVLTLDVLKCFVTYANKMGLNNFESNIEKYSIMDRKSNEWYERNQKCNELIKNMRMQGIEPIDLNTNLPTLGELQLMEYASTRMPYGKIKKILKRMDCKVKIGFEFSE